MSQIDYVFIDNGGVLTDNSARGPLYQRLVGRYFVPRYGGSQAAWEQTNLDTFPKAWARFLERVENWDDSRDLAAAERLHSADWMRFLLTAMGLTPPADDEECALIGEAADRWINPQIVTLFPGVEEAVSLLATRYRLFTASDGFSTRLGETLRPITGRRSSSLSPPRSPRFLIVSIVSSDIPASFAMRWWPAHSKRASTSRAADMIASSRTLSGSVGVEADVRAEVGDAICQLRVVQDCGERQSDSAPRRGQVVVDVLLVGRQGVLVEDFGQTRHVGDSLGYARG